MSRKRSRKLKPSKREEKVEKKVVKTQKFKSKKDIKYIIPIVLIAMFFLVLMFNAFFNFSAGIAHNPEGETLGTRFFLQGPDPYYNMRICQETLETGQYPFLTPETADPLLNYPVGVNGGARPPLFNMIAVASTNVLENFMPTMDALGWSMLFLPAIYGALLVFPVYGIGKELFGKKAGIISAFFVAIVPAHISGGHGSSLALFDHDSFILLLFAITFFFAIKTLKKESRNKKMIFGLLMGIIIGAIQLSWVAGQLILFLILGYMIVQLFFDIIKSKYHMEEQIAILLGLFVAFIISYPYFIIKGITLPFTGLVLVPAFIIVLITIAIKKMKLPAVLVFPISGIIGGIGVSIVYLAHIGYIKGIAVLGKLAEIIFGSGIYGNKVSLTIGEAHVFGLGHIAMSIGPIILWVGLVGFVLYMYQTHKTKYKSENLFVITMFIFQLWLLSTAGRFLNDLIPLLLVFNGFIVFTIIKYININKMMQKIRSVSGFKSKIKSIKPLTIIAIFFITFGMIGANTFLALDAATPPKLDKEIFGDDFKGYFGGSMSEQMHWADACDWLSEQDTEIENPADRPAIISWWDYGFYIVSMSGHPSVAENYQHGLFPAANFHTAQSEKEANAVLILRLVEGTKEKITKIDAVSKISNPKVKEVFNEYLGNQSEELINIIEDPVTYAPSYNTFVAEEYGNKIYRVRQHNAMYHDASKILVNLTDEELTELYLDIMEATGYSIRYYGIEGRDIHQIFGVFPFLADKSTHQYSTLEDDFFKTIYIDRITGIEYDEEKLNNMSVGERSKLDLKIHTNKKPAFYNSMIYRTYYGESEDNRAPTLLQKHWKIGYLGPAVMIAKYYAGAKINGSVKVGNTNYDGCYVFVADEYGIQHDYSIVNNGKFNLIAPAGNITIYLGIKGNVIEKYNIGEIIEEQAMREVPFESDLSFEINNSFVQGNVSGLNDTAILNITSTSYQGIGYSVNISNQPYRFENLIPDEYLIEVSIGNETLYQKTIFLKPNENIYNINIEG